MAWRNLSYHLLKVWDYDAYVNKFQYDKLEPKAHKCIFIGYPKQLGTSPISDPEAKCLFLEMGPFSRKELSGRVVELDEVIEPSLQPVCSRAHEVVPVAPTPIEVETDDSDH